MAADSASRGPAGSAGSVGTGGMGGTAIPRWAWPAALVGLIALAAILRFHDLATRGTWDADQGHDMLVLMAFVRDGTWPLLGPPTSIGDFHHGALYYYLLAPGAALGGGDPVVVVGEIAVLGCAAVGLVAILARSVAGTAAGLVAGLAMAVSATAIDESTFLWNPNFVAFTSALTVSAAWRAWSTRRARWWLLAAAGQAATMQCHVLGFVLLPPLIVWLGADLRRRAGSDRRRLAWTIAAGIAIVALSYVPLLASELQTDFHEARAAIAYLVGGGQAVSMAPPLRLTFVSLRVLAWPLTGLLTDGLAPGVAAGVTVAALAAWRFGTASGTERPLLRWIAATMAWSCLALGLGVAGLAFVTPLPVDHYHAFLDPLVFVALGAGAAGVWRLGDGVSSAADTSRASSTADTSRAPSARRLVRTVVVGAVGLLVVWNVTHAPPDTARDGGYGAAEAAAVRVTRLIRDRATLLISLPTIKSGEAYLYPLRRAGATVAEGLADPVGLDSVVVLCDSLFIPDCGGPAEDPAAGVLPGARLVDRFSPAPGRTISIYLRPPSA